MCVPYHTRRSRHIAEYVTRAQSRYQSRTLIGKISHPCIHRLQYNVKQAPMHMITTRSAADQVYSFQRGMGGRSLARHGGEIDTKLDMPNIQ